MKHSTMDLYGIDPKEFAELPYKDALTLKARKALEMKKKWREKAAGCINDDKQYQVYCEKYQICHTAAQHNMDLLTELETGEIHQYMEVM